MKQVRELCFRADSSKQNLKCQPSEDRTHFKAVCEWLLGKPNRSIPQVLLGTDAPSSSAT